MRLLKKIIKTNIFKQETFLFTTKFHLGKLGVAHLKKTAVTPSISWNTKKFHSESPSINITK